MLVKNPNLIKVSVILAQKYLEDTDFMSTGNGTAISTWPSEPREGLAVCTVFLSVVPSSDVEPMTSLYAVRPCRGL